MRKRVVPFIGFAWGVALIVQGFVNGFGDTGGAFRTGQIIAYLGGWALAAAGLSALIGRRHREWFEW